MHTVFTSLYAQINLLGGRVSPEEIAYMPMKHKGIWYRNSNLQPVSAEEQQRIDVAKSLFIDSTGNYVGDDTAIFGHCISADNDTRAARAFIQEQSRIIGVSADGVADHSPDKGHVMKCNNNALYKLAKDNPWIRGVHAFGPKWIKNKDAELGHQRNSDGIL